MGAISVIIPTRQRCYKTKFFICQNMHHIVIITQSYFEKFIWMYLVHDSNNSRICSKHVHSFQCLRRGRIQLKITKYQIHPWSAKKPQLRILHYEMNSKECNWKLLTINTISKLGMSFARPTLSNPKPRE